MPILGEIVELGTTQKGAPKLKIRTTAGEHWYYPGRTEVGPLRPGHRIEFMTADFGSPPRKGLNEWKFAQEPPKDVGAARMYPPIEAPRAPEKPVGPTPEEGYTSPFVSNVVAAAIAAGLITKPEQIRDWVLGAKGALLPGLPMISSGQLQKMNAAALYKAQTAQIDSEPNW